MLTELHQLKNSVASNRVLLNQMVGSQQTPGTQNNTRRSSETNSNPSPAQRISQIGHTMSSTSRQRQSSLARNNKTPNSSQRKLVNVIANSPNVLRPCWYHRQFGPASATCISPCSFKHPPTVPAAIPQPPLPLVQQPPPAPIPDVPKSIDVQPGSPPQSISGISITTAEMDKVNLSDSSSSSSDESDLSASDWNRNK